MLLNLSNHPSTHWPDNQLQAALHQYGTVKDLPFPPIAPAGSSDEINQLAEEYGNKIRKINPTAVHIMGELTFTHRLVKKLHAIGIPCIASTTERIAITDENGNKTSTFKFVRFREY